jgi:Schlafen, AlbA_2
VDDLGSVQQLRTDRVEHRRSLLLRPRESLAVELKSWFDPREPQGIAKIVKATFALRNQNGGFLVVGVDDKRLKTVPAPASFPPVRDCFHPDLIQQTVSKYASQSFEAAVDFETIDGQDYPIISLPAGIVTPVACRGDLKSNEGQFLLKESDVYVRTLGANGRISSARLSWRDIPDLFNRCFDNREADHARFFNKLLPGLGPELGSLLQSVPIKSEPDPTQTQKILERGIQRFTKIASERKVDVRSFGFWDVALHIAPEPIGYAANRKFLETLRNANPDLTGWPVWFDSSAFQEESARPYVFDNAWEAFIYAPPKKEPFWRRGHLDFSILDPAGRLFLRRVLQDDLEESHSTTAGKTVDPVIALLRSAEAIAVGQQFARALNCPEESTDLVFTFRWSGLRGRHLEAWSTPTRWFDPGDCAKQDSVESTIHFPLAGTRELIVTRTHEGILPLMRVFGGYEIKEPIVRELVEKLLDRKL